MAKYRFYIKERHNPQFKKPYYVGCGRMATIRAAKIENAIYGVNVMLPYNNEEEYLKALERFESVGYHVILEG